MAPLTVLPATVSAHFAEKSKQKMCLRLPRVKVMEASPSKSASSATLTCSPMRSPSASASETVLVQGGSSGIGVTALALAKALGSRVIVTAGSDEKCAACLVLGADHAINYRTQDFVAGVNALTHGRGADVILDMVAGEYIGRELQCVADDGRIALIAVQGGTASQIDAGLLLRKRIALTGSTLRPRSIAYKTHLAQALRQRVWPLIEQGAVRPVIHRVFDAADAAQAHALMESSAHVGKIVLRWS